MGFIAEVQTDGTDKWYSNDYVFRTHEEAADYAHSLRMRWMSVRNVRLSQTDIPASWTMVNGHAVPLPDARFQQSGG